MSLAAKLALSPLLVAQALRTQARFPRLPEAAGPRRGTVGRGVPLRVLIAGDSSAAGVGVATQRETLAGQLGTRLAEACGARVEWRLVARSGLTTAQTLHLLQREPALHADLAVVATGVNDWGTSYGISTGLTKGAGMFKATFPLMVMGVITFLVFPVIAVMLDKWGRMQTIIVTVLCASLGMLVMGAAPDPYSAICYIAAVFAGVCMAGSIAGANTLALDVAPITQMGAVMAGMNTMQPIGVLFFLILGGYLFDIVSPQSAFILKGGANLLLCIGLLAVRSAISKEITPAFTMDREPAAKLQMMKIPASVRQGAIEGAEAYAKDQNVTKITAEFCQNLRKMMEQGQAALQLTVFGQQEPAVRIQKERVLDVAEAVAAALGCPLESGHGPCFVGATENWTGRDTQGIWPASSSPAPACLTRLGRGRTLSCPCGPQNACWGIGPGILCTICPVWSTSERHATGPRDI